MPRTTSQTKVAPSLQALLPWALTAIVVFLAVYVWGSSYSWQLSTITSYQLFPVFGLLAFSILWSQYMAGVMRRTFLHDIDLHSYLQWTGYAVLVLILAHPGLLAYQRLRDGFGLPPHSETSYVMRNLAWVVALGMVNLLILLSFELRRWLSKYHWWRYTTYVVDVAMLSIFYHALELGTQTHITWYRMVWWFYGLSLIAALIYTRTVDIGRAHKRSTDDQ